MVPLATPFPAVERLADKLKRRAPLVRSRTRSFKAAAMKFFSRFSRRHLPDRPEFFSGYRNAPTKGHDPVRLVEDPVPAEAPVPGAWRRLPELPRAERVHLMVSLMRGCIGDVLPESLGVMEACCADAQLALWGGRYLVVYTLVDRRGEVEHFYGGNPCQPTWPAPDDEQHHSKNIRPVWSLVPEPLKSFYEQIHDGLCSVSFGDGIKELKDVERFNDSDRMDGVESGMPLYERFRGHYIFHEDPSYGVLLLDVNGREPGRAVKCYTVSEVASVPDFWNALDKDLVWSFMSGSEW
jgi:hypothetical protein